MSDKKIKKVQITENKLVDLIDSIVTKTIEEKIKKGELIKSPKIKKVTVTESELANLIKSGKVLSVKKK